MLRKTYDWTMAQATRPHALWILAAISFIESSIFPIPPDVLLIPMVLAARQRAWGIAAVCTAASVGGGYAGYAIGYFLHEAVGEPLLAFYGYQEKFAALREIYDQGAWWFVFGAGLTPFPYKVITITSGVMHTDPALFGIASVVSRGLRFFLVAALLWKFGDPIRAFIERHLGKLTVAFFVLLLGGFLALKALA